jgi:hypothetical protein
MTSDRAIFRLNNVVVVAAVLLLEDELTIQPADNLLLHRGQASLAISCQRHRFVGSCPTVKTVHTHQVVVRDISAAVKVKQPVRAGLALDIARLHTVAIILNLLCIAVGVEIRTARDDQQLVLGAERRYCVDIFRNEAGVNRQGSRMR